MIDLAQLKKLASEATERPWAHRQGMLWSQFDGSIGQAYYIKDVLLICFLANNADAIIRELEAGRRFLDQRMRFRGICDISCTIRHDMSKSVCSCGAKELRMAFEEYDKAVGE